MQILLLYILTLDLYVILYFAMRLMILSIPNYSKSDQVGEKDFMTGTPKL